MFRGFVVGALALALSVSASATVPPPVPYVEGPCPSPCVDNDADGVCADTDLDDGNPDVGSYPPIYVDGDPCWLSFFGIKFYVCWF